MKKFVCTICGCVYDEAAGIPESEISPGTRWEDLPPDWVCPLCGASKSDFQEQTELTKQTEKTSATPETHDGEARELSFAELSALCSNLSKGCEKQYRSEEAALFTELSDYYQGKSSPVGSTGFQTLSERIEHDLNADYPSAKATATQDGDRGALRALVWGEKVTRVLSSLLSRYETQKDALIERTNVYVCEICGFIYVGDEPPQICPVCKVPNMKLRKIEREAI
jgi:rubredoxin